MDKRFVAIVALVVGALAAGYFLLKRREYMSTHSIAQTMKEIVIDEKNVAEKLDEDVEKATVETK